MVTDDKKTNGTDAEKQAAAEDQKDPLLTSMQKLYDLLEKTSSYVDSVVDGTTPADPEMGREVADTLAAVPRIRPEVFDQLFNDSLQDLLMVEYLSSITRTQVTVAEKLNASLGV
jgi:translation initiation factor 3 subunit F